MSIISIMPKLPASAIVARVAVQARHLLAACQSTLMVSEKGVFGLTSGSRVFGPMQST
jgi:hypothetical protein